MINHLLIPANFNAQLLIDNELENFDEKYRKDITADNLNYICNCILYNLTHNYRFYKNRYKNGFVPLNAKRLRKVIRYHKNCINFLLKNQVIECDGYYLPGTKSYGFSLSSEYLGAEIIEIPLQAKLKNKITEARNKYLKENPIVQKLERKRAFLFEFLNSPLFQINSKAAIEYLEKNYAERKFNEYILKKGKSFNHEKYLKQIQQTKQNFKYLIHSVNNKHIIPKVDKSGYRLHSSITNLPKQFRNYLTYDNKPLVALDLKNSQPYFSTLILQKDFYQKKGKNLTLYKIDEELYKLLNKSPIEEQNERGTSKPSIMMSKIRKTLANTDDLTLKNYLDDAFKGNIYDRFINDVVGDPEYEKNRTAKKKKFIITLFNRVKKNKNTAQFINEYTITFEVFNLIKSVIVGETKKVKKYNNDKKERTEDLEIVGYSDGHHVYARNENNNDLKGQNKAIYDYEDVDKGYTKLAILLQRIESYLLLDVVCKRVHKEMPEIPLITIHDSIATTPDHIDFVEKVINEELIKTMMFPPKLTKEYWFKVNEIINI